MTASKQPEPVCANCGHLESDHKWYPQDEENWKGEEHWECRNGNCTCEVNWTDHKFEVQPEPNLSNSRGLESEPSFREKLATLSVDGRYVIQLGEDAKKTLDAIGQLFAQDKAQAVAEVEQRLKIALIKRDIRYSTLKVKHQRTYLGGDDFAKPTKQHIKRLKAQLNQLTKNE